MSVRVTSSSLPSEISEFIMNLLKHTQDPLRIRDSLKQNFSDLWIVAIGSNFSYNISRANKGVGLYSVESTEGKTKAIVYTPPYNDASALPKPSTSTAETPWKFTIQKDTINNEKLIEFIKTLDYRDTDKAINSIKFKLNVYKDKFWHVFIGEEFQCAVPNSSETLLLTGRDTVTKNKVNLVIFRQRGTKRQVKWSGISRLTGYCLMVLICFAAVIGNLRCKQENDSLICRHQDKLSLLACGVIMYVAFSYMSDYLSKKFKQKTP